MFDILVIGGGTSGVLAALQCTSSHSNKRIALFERRKQLLPYGDSADGNPDSNRSWTRNQLLTALADSPIHVYRSSGIEAIRLVEWEDEPQVYEIKTRRASYYGRKLILASGQDAATIRIVKDLGFRIRPFSPATFQLRCDDPRVKNIKAKDINVVLSWMKSGPPRKRIQIRLASELPEEQALMQVEGPISFQSGRISGTAVRQLSIHIAKQMEPLPERLKICINWLPEYGFQGILELLQLVARTEAQKTVLRSQVFELPQSIWSRLVAAADIVSTDRWQDLLPEQFQELATQLSDSNFMMKPDYRPKKHCHI